MCTQHPDSTVVVSTSQEVDEAIQSFAVFGCDEVMPDYEGKLTPYNQPKDIVIRSHKLNLPIGTKFFISPRVPNPSLEEFDRVDLSIEAGIVANYYSLKLREAQAVRWLILPMVEDLNILRLVQRLILRKISILREEINMNIENIQLVPLLEDVCSLLRAQDYIEILVKVLKGFGVELVPLRVFLGKSDTSVKSGHLASSLSIIYAMRKLHDISKESDMLVKPIIGMGSPPFRGGLNNPDLVDQVVITYRGFSTSTIQSAVRYDVSFSEYEKVRSVLENEVDAEPSADVNDDVTRIVEIASSSYRALVTRYLQRIKEISPIIPSTRERVSWRDYGRILPTPGEKLSVPRAIIYTSAWYTVGIPPALLDAETIISLNRNNKLDYVLKLHPSLLKEWIYESRFYIRDVALRRLDDHIVKLVDEAMDILGIKPEPFEPYSNLMRLEPLEPHVLALGRIRGFLG